MIGIMDSGNGGLTIIRTLIRRFPNQKFVYLGDHANAPYGNRSSEEIIMLTQTAIEMLYKRGCRLVILACNTATAIACRTLQQDWLPYSKWQDHNILGVIAPTVEAATQTPWAVTTPQYPQKNNTDMIAVFATDRTVESDVYKEEICKRCPKVKVVQQACPDLAGAIERGESDIVLDHLVMTYVGELMEKAGGQIPHRAILGCTHFPIAEKYFLKYLPASTRLLSQDVAVADSLEDYLHRHPHYIAEADTVSDPVFLTTGDANTVSYVIQSSWQKAHAFVQIA
jgi:glutamate racemase